MIRINQIKLPITHNKEDFNKAVQKVLRLLEPISDIKIVKKSVDARKKNELKYIYSVEVSLDNEEAVLRRIHNKDVMQVESRPYCFPSGGTGQMKERPVIVGTGPAGLFCGLMLAKHGYRPILIERGEDVDNRIATIETYWNTNELNKESNVQFGEGGAGTFSDGKLNTLVKDKFGRNKKVLELFALYGGPEDICYMNKPHIGTDLLREIVKNMRNDLIRSGGEVRFSTKLTDCIIEQGSLKAIECNNGEIIPCDTLILAIGHSARDTFELLYSKNLAMHQKAFAIGVRMEHPAEMINESQYGVGYNKELLNTADYKLVHHASNGRSVYSFCMCPGGFVVNASSEEKRIVVNGMSNHDRDEQNSNSAIVVNVTPEDFESDSPLAGVEFQRKWEEKAFDAAGGDGCIPIQLFDDFKNNKTSIELGEVSPCLKGEYRLTNLNECLPPYVINAIIDGVLEFDKKIKGFSRPDALLSGVETRTSSPVRFERDESFECNIKGIFPCGEGAGYAGGITSAAMDGIKVAEEIAKRYHPF